MEENMMDTQEQEQEQKRKIRKKSP